MELIDVYHKLYSICTDASDNKVDLQDVINRVWNIAAEIREFDNAKPIRRRSHNFTVEDVSEGEKQTLDAIFKQIREARENKKKRDEALLQLMREKNDRGGSLWVLYAYGRLRDWGCPIGLINGVYLTHEDAVCALSKLKEHHDDHSDDNEDIWNFHSYDKELTYEIERVEVEFDDKGNAKRELTDCDNALGREIERYEEELHGFESSSRADCINIARHFYDFGKLSRPKQSYNCEKLEDEVVYFWNSHALDFRLGIISVMDLLNMCAKHFAEWQRMRAVDEKLEDAK